MSADLLISQNSPLYAHGFGQIHSKVLQSSWHKVPLLHGFGTHDGLQSFIISLKWTLM